MNIQQFGELLMADMTQYQVFKQEKVALKVNKDNVSEKKLPEKHLSCKTSSLFMMKTAYATFWATCLKNWATFFKQTDHTACESTILPTIWTIEWTNLCKQWFIFAYSFKDLSLLHSHRNSFFGLKFCDPSQTKWVSEWSEWRNKV